MATTQIYQNEGNPALIDLLDGGTLRILDIGCGAGDNARLARSRNPDRNVFGITQSEPEAIIARAHMAACWVFDIEKDLPDALRELKFDAMIFSHVLEHLREPAAVLARFLKLLEPGGVILIAVPNILSYRMRWQFLLGNFEYQSGGELDRTHLRFLTYKTARQFVLPAAEGLKVHYYGVTGSVPLFVFRRHLLPPRWSASIDAWGCRHWPNLFGSQILIKASTTS
jgi:2-polyprenyl-3-methyl-5-hydroxy-6-metoxy-1,4-benzoquinol methylase